MDIVVLLVGKALTHRQAPWHATFLLDCGSDAATMTLVNSADGRRMQIGDRCEWSDAAAVASPDGRLLAVWKPQDGAASSIHLIEIDTAPLDVGEVPSSTSANYAATWTDDGRLWFTNDMGQDTGGIWSFQPGASRSRFVRVKPKVLVNAVVAQPLN